MSSADDMPTEERFEPDYGNDEPDAKTIGDAEDALKEPGEESFEDTFARLLGEAFGVKAHYVGSFTVPGHVEETTVLEPSGPLNAEQEARVEALKAARAVLKVKEASPGFGRGGAVTPPSLGTLIIMANFILSGEALPPGLPEKF